MSHCYGATCETHKTTLSPAGCPECPELGAPGHGSTYLSCDYRCPYHPNHDGIVAILSRLQESVDAKAADRERMLERNRRVLIHEAETPMRGHDPDGACCRRAALGADQ